MKKLFLSILGILLATSLAFAAADNKAIIASTTLDDDPTSVTSTVLNIQDYKKVAFFVYADETDSGNDTAVAVTLEISYDNSTWIATSFYDAAGGATPVTSETLCTGTNNDQDYYFWINKDQVVPYVRVVITGAGTDAGADDKVVVEAYMVGMK